MKGKCDTHHDVTYYRHYVKQIFFASTFRKAVMAILSFPAAISSIPPATRAFIAATVASTVLYFWLSWQYTLSYNPYLALIPGSSIFYPWTFFTSSLVETSIIEVGCFNL